MPRIIRTTLATIGLCSFLTVPALADDIPHFVNDLKAYLHFAKKDLWNINYYRGDDGLKDGTFYIRFRDRTSGRAGAKAHDETHEKIMALVCTNGINERSIKLNVPLVLMIVDHRKDVPLQVTPLLMEDCPQ